MTSRSSARPAPAPRQAAINAVHTDAETYRATDWPQILTLYNQLLTHTPTPVVALNRAIAVGEVHGPQAALDLVDQLNLPEYHAFHATRADLLRRLGRTEHAASAYDSAANLTPSPAERDYLAGQAIRQGGESFRRSGDEVAAGVADDAECGQ